MENIFKKMRKSIIKRLFFPVGILLLFFGAYLLYKIKIAPLISIQIQQNFKKHIISLFIICIGFILHRIFSAVLEWYSDNVATKTVTRLDDEMIPILSRSIKILLWVVVLLVILPFYGINISALVTALGVSSLAIALAAQDTISNIIAGFMIMVDRPFRLGDKIKLSSGEIVIVYDIGVRRSKFIFEDSAIIIVPNTDLSRSKIINYTYGEEELKKI